RVRASGHGAATHASKRGSATPDPARRAHRCVQSAVARGGDNADRGAGKHHEPARPPHGHLRKWAGAGKAKGAAADASAAAEGRAAVRCPTYHPPVMRRCCPSKGLLTLGATSGGRGPLAGTGGGR